MNATATTAMGGLLVATAAGAVPDPTGLTDEVLATGVPMPHPTVVDAVDGWRSSVPADASVDDLDWWFVADTEFAAPTRIVFDGVSFPTSVFVDDVEVAVAASMFLPVTATVGPGRHRIAVRFGSLHAWASTRRPRGRWRSSLVATQGLRWARTTLLGRAKVYGDVPAPVGFWRGITVSDVPAVTDLEVHADPVTGVVTVRGRCLDPDGTGSDPASVTVSLADPEGQRVETTAEVVDGTFAGAVVVARPRLWWPHGYGPQPLYRLTVGTTGGRDLTRTVGFRTLTVDTVDGGFTLVCNGVPIFARGAVWTPVRPGAVADVSVSTRRRLRLLADAGSTMVRIPGGLLPEGDEFADTCAELGLLVWQDAMLATFDPPTDLDDTVLAEVDAMLRAVSGNPSLAVVSGGSETVQQPVMLGLPREGRSMPLIEITLADRAAAYGLPYVESSPSAPPGSDAFVLRPDTGISHWFGVGGYRRPVADVVGADVRFAAECLAFSIPPSPTAIERHFGAAAAAGHTPGWKAAVPRDRGSAWDFEDVRDHYVAALFGVEPSAVRSRDPERWLQLGRIAVAEAMAACHAHWRTDPRCGGALVLTAADTAPGAGWGLIDADDDPKLPLAVLHRMWAPVAVVLRDAGLAGIAVDVLNDTDAPLVGELSLCATTDGGSVVAEGVRSVAVDPHGSLRLHDSEVTGVFRDLSDAHRFGHRTADAVEVVLSVDGSPRCREVFVVRPATETVVIPADAVAVSSHVVDGRWSVRLESSITARWVEIDCPGWSPADTVFHLAAGRPYEVAVTPEAGTDPDRGPRGRVHSLDLSAPVIVTAAP
ncbi:glycosyl hydrolase [Williamsia sp. MIQD14]|uniref:glycosyl hydrolase n=1 Tax=Williamsia sp. MIQD14 TaxID=3425703 RepID=UPI003DA0FE79